MNLTIEEKTLDAKEYVSLILTLDLASEFNKETPNKAIKRSAKIVSERIKSPRIKAICSQVRKSPYPVGVVKRLFNNIGRAGSMTVEQFITAGVNL